MTGTAAEDRGTRPTPPWRRGLAVAVDQTAFSLANFGAALAIANYVPSADHGRFAISFAGLTLALQFHAAWVTTPLLMLAQRQSPEELRQYLGAVVRMHLRVSAYIFLATLLVAAVTWPIDPILSRCLAVASGGIVFSASHVGVRKMCMAITSPRGAATSSLVGLLAMGLGLLLFAESLTASTAWVVIGVASLMGTVASFPWILQAERPSEQITQNATKRHGEIGRWGLGAATARWIPQGAPFLLLPLLRPADGLVLAGNLKACLTLLTPPLRISAALSQAAIPEMTRRLREGQPALTRSWAAAAVACSALWMGLTWFLGKPLLVLIYGLRAGVWAPTLHALSALPLLYTIVTFLNSLQLARHRPKGEFFMHVWAALGFFALTLPLVPTYGNRGAAWGILGAYVVSVAYYFLSGEAQKDQSPGGST